MGSSRVLITGGAGYIGSHVVHQMLEAGYDLTVVDNLSTGFRRAVPEGVKFHELDLGNETELIDVFRQGRFDALIHFAADVQVGESVEKPAMYYRNNTVNSLRLFDLASRFGVRSTVFSSTASVYGESRPGLLREDAATEPINPYGWSKLMSERILHDIAFSSAGALRFVVLRYFNVAGARPDLMIGQSTSNATRLIKIAAECAAGVRSGMSIFGTDYPTLDGTCERDYIHVEDLSRAHLDALAYLARGGASETFNVGYGHATSVRAVIDTMKSVSKVAFRVTESPRRAGDPAILAADTSKIRRVLSWSPRYDDLREICGSAYQWELKLREMKP
ncbi:MAG: UDP-glucose 4-epimerase GalE [Bdellovibrionota bacterium]